MPPREKNQSLSLRVLNHFNSLLLPTIYGIFSFWLICIHIRGIHRTKTDYHLNSIGEATSNKHRLSHNTVNQQGRHGFLVLEYMHLLNNTEG